MVFKLNVYDSQDDNSQHIFKSGSNYNGTETGA